jgi:hypothetical protein
MLPASTEATTDKVSFIGGFKNGQTVSQIIDAISTVSRRMPDTSKYTKTYTLVLDPPGTPLVANDQQTPAPETEVVMEECRIQ